MHSSPTRHIQLLNQSFPINDAQQQTSVSLSLQHLVQAGGLVCCCHFPACCCQILVLYGNKLHQHARDNRLRTKMNSNQQVVARASPLENCWCSCIWLPTGGQRSQRAALQGRGRCGGHSRSGTGAGLYPAQHGTAGAAAPRSQAPPLSSPQHLRASWCSAPCKHSP